jgi:hypothetical protein
MEAIKRGRSHCHPHFLNTFRLQFGIRKILPEDIIKRNNMSFTDLTLLIISAGTMAYLLVALVKAEEF